MNRRYPGTPTGLSGRGLIWRRGQRTTLEAGPSTSSSCRPSVLAPTHLQPRLVSQESPRSLSRERSDSLTPSHTSPASPHPPPSLAQHSSQSAQQAHQATPCWELSDGSCPPLNKSPTLSGLSTPHPQPPTSSTPLSPLQQRWALHYLEPLGTRWPQCLCTCSGHCLEAILQSIHRVHALLPPVLTPRSLPLSPPGPAHLKVRSPAPTPTNHSNSFSYFSSEHVHPAQVIL